jgi:hypothetical protein
MNKRVIFEIDISRWPLRSRELMHNKKFSIARSLGAKALGTIGLSNNSMARFSYSWNDPYSIGIEARLAKPREKVSGKFMSYEWMIDNLVKYGTVYGGEQ